MNKIQKKVSLMFLSVTLVLSMFCAVISVLSGGYKKAFASVTNIAPKNDFCVIDGASVRTKPGSSGIRFTTRISADFYNQHNDGSYGTIIGKEVSDISELTVENAESSEYPNISLFQPCNEEGQPVEIVPVQENGSYVYRTTITFNTGDKTPEQLADAFGTKLNVRSYFLSEAGELIYTSTDADTLRSISEVSEKVLLDDALKGENSLYDKSDFAPQKEILKGYITGLQYADTISQQAYVTKTGDNYTITGLDNQFNGEKTIYLDGIALGVRTVADNSLTVSSSDFGEKTAGDYFYVAYTKEDGKIVQQSVQYVTEIITDADQLKSVIEKNRTTLSGENAIYNSLTSVSKDCYYILGADIEYTPTNSLQGNSAVFFGTLDGKGHSITTTGNGAAGGLFGTILRNSEIKNLKVTTISYNQSPEIVSSIIAMEIGANVCLENMVIAVKSLNGWWTTYPTSIVSNKMSSIIMKNVIITTGVNNNLPEGTSVSIGKSLDIANSVFKDVYILTPSGSKIQVAASTAASYNSFTPENTYYPSNTTVETENKLNGVYTFANAADMPEKVGDWLVNKELTEAQIGTTAVAAYEEPENTVSFDPSDFVAFFNKIEILQEGMMAWNGSDGSAVQLTNLEVADGTYSITIGGTGYGDISVSGNSATLPDGTNLSNLVLGNYYKVELTSESNVYIQTVQYVTEIITTTERLQEIIEYYHISGSYTYVYDSTVTDNNYSGKTPVVFGAQPYYVLGADLSDYVSPHYVVGSKDYKNPIFHGVLDGKGHKIIIKSIGHLGLFGTMNDNALLKNVELVVDVNYGTNEASSGIVAGTFKNNVKIENTVITLNKLSWYWIGDKRLSLVARNFNNASMKDVLINVNTEADLNSSSNTQKIIGLGEVFVRTDENQFQNVHIVLPKPAQDNTNDLGTVMANTQWTYDNAASVFYYAENDTIQSDNKLNGVFCYKYDQIDGLPSKIGSWEINAENNIGKDACVKPSADIEFAKFNPEYEKYEIATGEETEVNLVSYQGLFNGIKRFKVQQDGNVVEIADGKIKGVNEGSAKITVSYQINGEVYLKTFSVTVR